MCYSIRIHKNFTLWPVTFTSTLPSSLFTLGIWTNPRTRKHQKRRPVPAESVNIGGNSRLVFSLSGCVMWQMLDKLPGSEARSVLSMRKTFSHRYNAFLKGDVKETPGIRCYFLLKKLVKIFTCGLYLNMTKSTRYARFTITQNTVDKVTDYSLVWWKQTTNMWNQFAHVP